MNRARLLEEIAELDRRINQELANTKVPSLNLKHRAFPVGSWVSTIVFLGYWLYGDVVMPELHDKIELGAFVLGILSGLFAIYNTIMWVLRSGKKTDSKYAKATSHVTDLQEQKMQLQKQLQEMDEK